MYWLKNEFFLVQKWEAKVAKIYSYFALRISINNLLLQKN